MNNLTLNWIYNTNNAIESIITYISGLYLIEPNTGQRVDYIVWPPGQANPVPYEYDPELSLSGFVEDLRPIKEQLGRAIEPDGTIASGSIWNIDYEFHLEHGTKAMLQPVVDLANNTIKPALDNIVNHVNLMKEELVSKQPIIIGVSKDQSDDFITYTTPSDWNPVFNHWPNVRFMRSQGLDLNVYKYNDLFLDNYISITVSTDFPTTYTLNLGNPDGPTDISRWNGILLVW